MTKHTTDTHAESAGWAHWPSTYTEAYGIGYRNAVHEATHHNTAWLRHQVASHHNAHGHNVDSGYITGYHQGMSDALDSRGRGLIC